MDCEDKNKVESWSKTLPKLLKNHKIPDPYITDKKGYNAFDALSTLASGMIKYNSISTDRKTYLETLGKFNIITKRFLEQEIARVTSDDFAPRFTGRLE